MCGIAGIFGHPEAANLTYLCLSATQHRGQEGAGICSSDGQKLFLERGLGEIRDIFHKAKITKLPGSSAIGHNRYSTTGSSSLENIQPFKIEHTKGPMAICHNGNLVNAHILRRKLEESGSIFSRTSDTEVILHLIVKSAKETFLERLIEALSQIKGSYSLLILTKEELIAVRDPLGIRPLCLGELDGVYVLGSESCSFDLIEAKYQRDIQSGEVLVINKEGLKSYFPFPNPGRTAFCLFEEVYFKRPDSLGPKGLVSSYSIKKQLGIELAKEDSISVDIVSGVPDSAIPHAMGNSFQSGIPYEQIIIRSHSFGYRRTFIEPHQEIRDFGAKLKYNPVPKDFKDKKVRIIDDSIIRGTTSEKIIRILKRAGVGEVHYRVASSPIKFSCTIGIDMQTSQELIASQLSVEEIRKKIDADSLQYLSLEGMYRALKTCGFSPEEFCDACFTGNYPIEIPAGVGKFSLEH